MFLIPGIAALFTFVYVRPQEIFEVLRPVSLAGILGILTLGYVLDARLGVARARMTPLFGISLALFMLCLVSVAIKVPDKIGDAIIILAPAIISFLFVSQGLQTLRALTVAAAVLLGLTLLVTAVAVEQGLASPICYVSGLVDGNWTKGETPDWRPCVVPRDCIEGGPPGADFQCERPGIFSTHTIGGRVRFRGLLEDPNELAWVISMGVPLAFAFYERRRSLSRLSLLVVTLILSTACVVMTMSRSGQMSLAAVLAVYFIRRFGWRGAVAAVVAAGPVIFLGGRSGEGAESSSEERLGCWAEALAMWRENPLLGVGQGQFIEHHFLTAHSSLMLTLAELGPAGLILWSAAVYLAFKITIRVHSDFAHREETRAARTWALAFLSSMVGLMVSAFFLSIAYNAILWTFLGLVAALYTAVRAHEPGWRVPFGWRDLALVIGLDTAIMAGAAFYIRLKGI